MLLRELFRFPLIVPGTVSTEAAVLRLMYGAWSERSGFWWLVHMLECPSLCMDVYLSYPVFVGLFYAHSIYLVDGFRKRS